METTKTIYQLHEDHKTWLNKLAFYTDEIQIMQNRISEIAKKNTSKEVRSFVEHFQNQLIVQKEQIDILKHEVNSHERSIEEKANKKAVANERKKFVDHSMQRSSVESFEKIFNDLRKELAQFLSKWM
ncbi:MAG: hypothetical protein K8R85_02805 [Bacteroidetes bacterium]|nr:hypothetical protein [Bacteroidota bacterium]